MTKIKIVFVRNFVLFILMALIGVLLFMLRDFSKTKERLLEAFISKPLQTISLETDAFFSPINHTLQVAMSHGTMGKFSIHDTASINKYFVPMLLQIPQISGMGVADNQGYEHDIIKISDKLSTRTIRYGTNDKLSYWATLSLPLLNKDSVWITNSQKDPRSRIWHKGALLNPTVPYLTEPYIFNTNHERGITISCTYPDYSVPDSFAILALDFTLKDLGTFNSGIQISKSGFGLILSSSYEVLEQPAAYSEYSDRAIKILAERRGTKAAWMPFKFKLEDDVWWAQFNKLSLEGQDIIVGVVLPASEVIADLHRTQEVIYIGLSTTILLMMALFWTHKEISSANKLLFLSNIKIREQSVLVGQKNVDILESIYTAERLQKAMLPSAEKIERLIPNCFVMYLPKDVVSGDFYWMKKQDRTLFFAVADCTGHGVPGAFMSILGMEVLKIAVSDGRTSSPAHVLKAARRELIKRLVSDLEQTKEGMDVTLCSFDLDTHILKFSGALSNLYLVRRKQLTDQLEITSSDGVTSIDCRMQNDTHQLFFIKGDRIPIGFTYPGQPTEFLEYSLKIQSGDTIYLTSDGFSDQFGGERGKKFGRQRFRKALLNIQSKAIKSQLEEMNRELENWKKNEVQVDDICVMGVQLIE